VQNNSLAPVLPKKPRFTQIPAGMIFLFFFIIHNGMPNNYQNLSERELIEKLAELNEQMAHARRINADHDAIKKEILAVQDQIETVRKASTKKWRFL
jgi:hypothetical protein